MANCFCLKWRPDVVKVLDFRHCNLLFVPEEVFEFGETLEELFLDSNDIRDLPRPLFHCQNLKKLGASDNELFSIPPAIASLINLKELDISKNGIVELPDGIKGCRELDLIEVSVNPLGKLPEGFTQLINLTQLYLNDTLLDFLPANFGRLIKLKVLELRENHLKSLPRSISRLTELERLDLGQNSFQELPDVVGNMTNLQELWIDANRVTEIPESIGSLKKLFYFDASRNRIEELPETVSGWDSIKDIHLSKNFIQSLPSSLGQLSSLSTLRVDNNQISCLPYSMGGLVSLEELILNANDLEELPSSIGLLRKLRHLNIDDNMLMSLPTELGSCNKISLLSLRGNYLEYLPDEIGRISSLAVANFSNNRLKHLPYSFTKLKNLQALWLSENQSKPLIPLQSEILGESGKRVLTCFLLPQLPPEETEYGDDVSDEESFHMSVWSQKRKQRMIIAFDVSESEPETVQDVKNRKQAYPKESFRPRYRGGPNSSLANGHVPSGFKEDRNSDASSLKLRQRQRVRGRRELAEDGSVDGSIRSSRPRSPVASTISDSLHLYKADKEKRAKDKERMRRSSMSSKEDGGSRKENLQVQWELPVGPPKPHKKRSKRGIISRDRGAVSDSEVVTSHPMRMRSPRSKKHQQQKQMDETDREVAELTNGFKERLSERRENNTDTETASVFSHADMPDVVFHKNSFKKSAIPRSASMEFSSSAGYSPNKNQNRFVSRKSNGTIPNKVNSSVLSQDFHSSRTTPNSLMKSRQNPLLSANTPIPSGEKANYTLKSSHGSSPNVTVLQRPPVNVDATGKQERSKDYARYSLSRKSFNQKDGFDNKEEESIRPVAHHQWRDSGISDHPSPAVDVTDPELDRLYEMRYRRNTPHRGEWYGSDVHGSGTQKESFGHTGSQGGQFLNSGYSTDPETAYKRGQSEAASRLGHLEKNRFARKVVTDNNKQENQQWKYNPERDASSKVAGSKDRGTSFSPSERTKAPSTPDRSQMYGSLSKDARFTNEPPREGSLRRSHPRSAPSGRPWDTKESPLHSGRNDGQSCVPGSEDYSNQLRQASSQLLSPVGGYMSQQQSYVSSATPSLSYQYPSSARESSVSGGARRHLRFSSENQSLQGIGTRGGGNDEPSKSNSSTFQVDSSKSKLSTFREDRSKLYSSKDVLPDRTKSQDMSSGISNYKENTPRTPDNESFFHNPRKTNKMAHASTSECSGHQTSSFNANQTPSHLEAFQERAVDVPADFLERQNEVEQSQPIELQTPCLQFRERIQPVHSTPYNRDFSDASSGRPFTPADTDTPSIPSTRKSPLSLSTGKNYQPVSSDLYESTEEDVRWAVPKWVHDGREEDEAYLTDENKNRFKYPSDRSNAGNVQSFPSQREADTGGNVSLRRRKDRIPDPVEGPDRTSSSEREINQQNWKDHLINHLQHNGMNQINPASESDNKRLQLLRSNLQTEMNPVESDDVFQPSAPSPSSPPPYHKAVAYSHHPVSSGRRNLPLPPQGFRGKDDDIRRVTPPGSSGSSTTSSYPRNVPQPYPLYNKPQLHQQQHSYKAPPPYGASPQVHRRTAPDGMREQWL